MKSVPSRRRLASTARGLARQDREDPLVRHLLDAPVPADLTALVLGGDQFGAGGRNELRRKYGDRVVFAAG